MTTIPAYTIGGLTRPELQLDSTGHIVLDAAAQAFADTYGLQYLYLGCPPGTLWPPVTDSLSAPVDANSGNNTVIESAVANTLVNITALATSTSGNAVTYSLTGDTSSGGFKIDPNTGVVSVADPTKINYVTSPGHAYTITVQASDGIATSSQSFAIAVTDVAPSTPVDSNAAANKVAEGATAGTPVGITATSTDMNAVTYSLTGDSSGGGFTINATTGVITVADPSKINYATAPGHAYTVTATASDGTLSSSQTFTIDVTLGAATHFTVSIPANGAAGTPGTVTVTALDALNHVVTNYTGTVHFTSTDGHAALPADVTLTNGTGSFSETLDTAGSQTITATDTADSAVKGTSNPEIVTPGVATHYSVSLPANGTAGTPGSAIVTALDAFNNVATSYSGIVHFTSSDGSAVLPADMTLTNGTGSFNETFKTAGSQTITAIDTVSAINGTSNTETVAGGAATHLVVSIPASGAAGTPGSVIVTALDAFGNVATGYSGTVHFTSSDGHAVLPADVTLTNGTGSFSETFETVGSQTIIATDTASPGITGTSNTETVTAGPVTHFSISIPGSSSAGIAGSGTVTALDAFGNVVTGYAGTVHFTSTDSHAVLPANMTLTNGTATFSETLDTAGSQTITATDTVTSTITGTSNVETVTAAAITHFAVSIPTGGSAGTAGSGTVTALDAFGNVVTGYAGTVHFTSTDSHAVLPANMTLTNGTATFSETLDTAGSQTITATDTVSAIAGTSNAENVAPGPATHFAVSIPANGATGAAGSVTVTALDAFGNVATGYTGAVHFTSSDGSAVLPANMTLTNGIGTFSETFETTGNQTITATDTVNTAITGTSNSETVTVPDLPPTATVPADSSVGTAFSHTNLAISGLSITDVSATGNDIATISSSHGGLTFDTAGLASFTNNGSHTVTLTGTVAQINTALATLTYNSDAGFTGSDTISLNVADNNGSAGPLSSGPQSFHIGVVPHVFYIDNSASASANLGTQANPYTSIAAFNAANSAGAGDYVVLEHGTGSYSEANGIHLGNGVNLIGGSHTLQFTNPVTNQVVNANVGSGTDPVITVTGVANGIDLLGTSGHTITGVSIDTSASSGIGISDDGNNVGTVTMSDIAIKTASGAGLSFTHGGTITVTGSANTITSTTGTALDVENTNIGSGNITFQSISSTGSSNNAGIILNNTGSAGGLHVTGTGTAGSGGTISSKTGADIVSVDANTHVVTVSGTGGTGIFLQNTVDTQLNHVQLNDFSNYAIFGNNVTGFQLANSTINGTNGNNGGTTVGSTSDPEASVQFYNLHTNAADPTASITNSSISGGAAGNVWVANTNGTLSRLVMTGDTIGFDAQNAAQSHNVNIQAYNNGTTLNFTFGGDGVGQGNTITGSYGTLLDTGADAGTSMDLVIRHDHFQNGETQVTGGGGINIRSGGSGAAAAVTFDVSDNSISAAQAAALFLGMDSSQNASSGTIAGNTITNVGDNGDGIFVRESNSGTLTTLIQNNTITGASNSGIALQNNSGSATLNATLYGNSVSSPTSVGPFAALDVENGATATDTSTTNVVIGTGSGGTGSKNTLNHSTLYATDVELSNFGANTHLNLSKNGSTSGTPAGVITDDNTSTTGGITVDTTGGNGTTTLVSTLPTLPAVVAPLLAEAGGVQASTPNTGEMHLTQAELNSVVSAAIAEWASAGANATQLALLHAATFSIADLAGQIVGQEGALHITIDTDAAGHGWFIDPTPSDNFEFTHAVNAAGTDLLTDPSTAAAGHLDLLTTVVHELGHVLGLPDSISPSDANSLMYIGLADGERRLPTAADVAQSNAALQKAMPTQGTATSGQQTTTTQTTNTSSVDLPIRHNFDFSSFTQTQSQTNTSHTDLTANTQTLSDLFSGQSSAATPWWVGHETTYAAMGGNPTDHLQTHHDLVV